MLQTSGVDIIGLIYIVRISRPLSTGGKERMTKNGGNISEGGH